MGMSRAVTAHEEPCGKKRTVVLDPLAQQTSEDRAAGANGIRD